VQLLVGLAGADPLLTTIQDALAELARQLPMHAVELEGIAARLQSPRNEVLEAYRVAQFLAFASPQELKPAVTRLTDVDAVLTRIRDFAMTLPATPHEGAPTRCAEWTNAVQSVLTYARAGLAEIQVARDDAAKADGFTKANLRALFKGVGPMFPPRLASVVDSVGNVATLSSSCISASVSPMIADAAIAARLQR
jgi:hypothetical protein